MVRPVKPPYVSARRAASALATRQVIVDAALRLFAANGYVATTIQSVADEAGVAVQTVYAVFGNKRELLRHALEAAIAGDTAPQPVNERPEFLAIAEEPDPRRRAELDAALSTQISRRLAPIMNVLREAAAVDPEFTATAKSITAQRRRDMAAAAEILAGPNGVRGDLEDVVGTLYVLYSPWTFLELTDDLGWSVKRYQRWLAEMLYRTVTT
jgi:AcrR family transcriptional regulator